MKKTDIYKDENNFSTVLFELIRDKDKVFLEAYKNYLQTMKEQAESENEQKKYADRLKEVSKRNRLINDDIVFITGKDKSTVSRWLDLHSPTLPTVQVVCDIAKAFGITTDYLLGVSGTPDAKIEEEYKVFKKYGINPDAFLNLKEFYDNSQAVGDEVHLIRYKRLIEGLNLLLMQKGEQKLDILSDIGELLAVPKKLETFLFDSDDIDNLLDSLCDDIQDISLNKEYIRDQINVFLDLGFSISPEERINKHLENIKIKLLAYKKELHPECFTRETPSK